MSPKTGGWKRQDLHEISWNHGIPRVNISSRILLILLQSSVLWGSSDFKIFNWQMSITNIDALLSSFLLPGIPRKVWSFQKNAAPMVRNHQLDAPWAHLPTLHLETHGDPVAVLVRQYAASTWQGDQVSSCFIILIGSMLGSIPSSTIGFPF